MCWRKPCICRELQFRHTCYLPIFSPLLFKLVFLLVCLFIFFRTICVEILYFIIDISGAGYSANIFIAVCTVLILHLHKSCGGKYSSGSRNMQFPGVFYGVPHKEQCNLWLKLFCAWLSSSIYFPLWKICRWHHGTEVHNCNIAVNFEFKFFTASE